MKAASAPVLALSLATALVASVGHQAAAAEGRISEVTLSSGGLAEIVRTVPAGDGEVRFEVPLEQVDDVLKSLVVLGGGGRVRSMSLGGPSAAEDALNPMPFTAQDMRSLPRLLDTLQGTRVRVSGDGRETAGQVLGVEAQAGREGAVRHVLSLMRDDGATEMVDLDTGTSAEILDAAVLAKLRLAAQAVGAAKADAIRTVRLVLERSGEGDVALAYVVAAPIWKTAYRVVTGQGDDTARLQAWAVLENATGEAWDDVRLTLSSGSPVTLRQRLHQRYWRERPEVPVDVTGAPVPRPDSGGIAREMADDVSRAIGGPVTAAMAPMPPRQSFAEMEMAAEAEASEADVTATYAVEGTVDVAAGDTLSVPLVDREVAAERIALFQRGLSGEHPAAALMVENDTGTSLPPGILTIYDAEAGYVGDAQLLGLPPGETRMIGFAIDRKMRVRTDDEPGRDVTRVRIVDGMLRASVATVERTVYRIEGAPDAARTVVIEHPRRPGWQFSSDALADSSESHHRLRVEVAAGGTATVAAVQRLPREEVIALTEATAELFASWASAAGDPALADALDDLAEARTAMVETRAEIAGIERDLERLVEEQERIRRNLGAVPRDSTLRQRYLDEMTRQEDEIAAAKARRAVLEETLETRQAAFDDVLRRL